MGRAIGNSCRVALAAGVGKNYQAQEGQQSRESRWLLFCTTDRQRRLGEISFRGIDQHCTKARGDTTFHQTYIAIVGAGVVGLAIVRYIAALVDDIAENY